MELILLLAWMLGGPVLLALLLVAFIQAPSRARLTIDLHGLRWKLRAGHLRGWATAPAFVGVVAALAWPELLLRSFFAQDAFMCGQVGPPCEPVWATSTLTAAALLVCVLAWPWLRTRLRRHPAVLRVDTDTVLVGAARVPWSDIAGVHVERRGWPIRYQTLVLETNPPVRIAVDRERPDTIDRALVYLTAASEALTNPEASEPVPQQLRTLQARPHMRRAASPRFARRHGATPSDTGPLQGGDLP